MQERGRTYKDKLDQISNEYAALHSLLKRLIKSEEESHNSREIFKIGWFKLSEIEENPALVEAYREFARAVGISTEAQQLSLAQLKDVVQDALRVYSLRLKQQRRSLSRRGKSEERAVGTPSQGEEDITSSMLSFELKHIFDMKMLLLHLINAEMNYHTHSLQALSDSYQSLLNIEQE